MEDGGGKEKGTRDSPEAQRPRTRERGALEKLEQECREAAGLENDPSPSLMVIGPIAEMIEAAWALQRQLPVLRKARAQHKRGRSWEYYLPMIREARGQPLPPPPAKRDSRPP